jgi:hypothetical protein
MIQKLRETFLADEEDDGSLMMDFNQFLPENKRLFHDHGYIITPSRGCDSVDPKCIPEPSDEMIRALQFLMFDVSPFVFQFVEYKYKQQSHHIYVCSVENA